MGTMFPFGFPWPSAMYLTLLVITASVYTVFMQYVLAGGLLVLIGGLAPSIQREHGAKDSDSSRLPSGFSLLVATVREWLPFALGLAITTGIAPLLFLQILYQRPFYTAALLMSHRFMLLLPALILAYYMLYLLKFKRLENHRPVIHAVVAAIAAVGFAYTAWAWVENHVLSLHEEAWVRIYQFGLWSFSDPEIAPRIGLWTTASFATLAVALACQLHWDRRIHPSEVIAGSIARLRMLGLASLALAGIEAMLWMVMIGPEPQQAILGPLARPYVAMILVGLALQVSAWYSLRSPDQFTTRRLATLSTGLAASILGALVVREARRLEAINLASLYGVHAEAAQIGGRWVFFTFLLVNLSVIAACIRMARGAVRSSP